MLLLALLAVAAAFPHAAIWAHYYSTELPDMRRIYGPPNPNTAEPSR